MTDTPERPELLPCPFCGWQITDDDVINENGRDGEATGDVGGIEYWRGRCIECGGMCDGAENRSEAVANWNRRASSLGEPVSQEAPVISSASPLSEDERETVAKVRSRCGALTSLDGGVLLAIIDRLSASAPSPEDKGSET